MSNSTKTLAHRTDSDFKHKLRDLYEGETLKYCYQCGTCSAACPIAKLLPRYRPNQILEQTKMGIRNHAQSFAFMFCSACTLCTRGCPQGVKVHEIMQGLKDLAATDEAINEFLNGGFRETINTLAGEMPFPVSYTWICLHPSDKAMGAFEAELVEKLRSALPSPDAAKPLDKSGAKRVAVIGSGPAGITAAWQLNRLGYAVTVFENLAETGGMLRVGIPEYRLPKDVVDAEIKNIEAGGVEIKINSAVDHAAFERIAAEYDAVFVATGAFLSRGLRIEGTELSGVKNALEVLREYNNTGRANIGKRVVVVGGGNVSMDAAGAALRSGADSVQLFCLESSEEMPSHKWEIDEADRDGVQINPSWGPLKILGDNGKVTGVEFARCKSVLDANGRFNPVFDDKKTQVVEADTVIFAIGQAPDINFTGGSVETMRGTIAVAPLTMKTSLEGVFAGGDAVSGTASLVEAIIAGKTAAASIDEYLRTSKG